MRRIDLLPPEERRRRPVRAPGGTLAILLIVGAVAVIFMTGIYLYYLLRLDNVRKDIAELDQQISEQSQRVAELAPYRDLQARLDAKKPVADGIYRTRFPWDEFLSGLAFVIPTSTALEGLNGQAAPINIQAPAEQPLSPSGAVTFTGVALPEYQNVADFVVQMNNLRFLANSQLNSAELDRETFAQPAINFEVASELITEVGANGTEVRIDASAPVDDGSPEEAVGLVGDQVSGYGGER